MKPAAITSGQRGVDLRLLRLFAAVAAWVVLVHAGLWWLYYHPSPKKLWGDETTYVESARRLLAGDPSWWPESLWPPLYPQFIAGLLEAGGGSLVAVQMAQTLLLAVVAALLFDLVRHLTGSQTAGLAAAALTLGYPPLAAFCHYLWPEVIHLFFFVTAVWLLARRWSRPAWCAVAGVVLGMAVLTKSLLLPFLPVLLIAAAWGTRPGPAALRLAILIGAMITTLSPGLATRAGRSAEPMAASSASFNLWVGLNDIGPRNFEHDVVWPEYRRWLASAPEPAARDQILRAKTADLIRERGIVRVFRDQLSKQYFRLFDVGSYLTDQVAGGPARERDGTGYLGAGPRVSRLVRASAGACYLLLLVAAPLGLALGACRGSRWVRAFLVFVAYNLALFLWLHVKTRYRIQMLPAAFVGVGCLAAWLEAGCRPRPSVVRIGGVSVVLALLIWFAVA